MNKIKTKQMFWKVANEIEYVSDTITKNDKGISDQVNKQFGMRDFTRKGKFFYLNGEKIILRGTNVTLQRFFEDPDCGNLVWDKEWVKKLLVDTPKKLNWNMMRICVGIAPDFWRRGAHRDGLGAVRRYGPLGSRGPPRVHPDTRRSSPTSCAPPGHPVRAASPGRRATGDRRIGNPHLSRARAVAWPARQ